MQVGSEGIRETRDTAQGSKQTTRIAVAAVRTGSHQAGSAALCHATVLRFKPRGSPDRKTERVLACARMLRAMLSREENLRASTPLTGSVQTPRQAGRAGVLEAERLFATATRDGASGAGRDSHPALRLLRVISSPRGRQGSAESRWTKTC